jgi:hypothetical protein
MKNISRTSSKTTKTTLKINKIDFNLINNLLPSNIRIPQARRTIERPFAQIIKYFLVVTYAAGNEKGAVAF